MFNDKILKSVAEAVKEVLQQEALKGQQHKIDKNKNNKIDAHDFKILRGEKKAVKEDAEQIDEISSTLANKYLNAPQGKGANKYKVGDTGTTKKNIYPDAETMSKHSKSVRQAIQRSGSSSIFKKPSYYKEEAEQIDEEINVKKDYDDHEQSEHGVYKGKRKIGYIVHNKKAGTHTAYHGHKYGKDDYENSDDFKSHEHALNQIKKSAGINESNNPFDLKNYKSQLPTKPGEKAGFDSKKISTGTVYSRKPVKDEKPLKEEDAYDKDRYAVKDGKAVKDNPGHMGSANYKDQPHHVYASSAEEALKKKGMKEEASNDEFHAEVEKAKKKSLGQEKAEVAKPAVSAVKQESVEHLDELKKDTLKSYVSKATDSARTMSGYGTNAEKNKKTIRHAGISKATEKLAKEEVEQIDEATMTNIKLGQKVKNSDGGHNQDVHYKGKKIGSIESYKHRTGLRYGSKHDASGEQESGSRSPEEAVNFVRTAHAEHLKSMKEEVEQIDERHMTEPEMKKREKIVKSMKKGMQGFKERYGDRAKNVLYATATKQAMKD